MFIIFKFCFVNHTFLYFRQKIFQFGEDNPILNIHIQSLASETQVELEIVDNFVNILNFEERLTQQHMTAIRFFFKTIVIVSQTSDFFFKV